MLKQLINLMLVCFRAKFRSPTTCPHVGEDGVQTFVQLGCRARYGEVQYYMCTQCCLIEGEQEGS